MTGGIVAFTTMTWSHVAVLPQASVAWYVLVITYWFSHTKAEMLDATIATSTTPPQLSVAGSEVAGGGTSSSHATVISVGHVSMGATSSNTVIVCTHVEELPHSSMAT